MKTVIFEHIPDDCEWRKSDQPQAPLAGTQVHSAAAVKALLAYGTYDKYLYLSRQTESADYNILRSPALEPYRDRVALLPGNELERLQSYDHVVFNSIFVDRVIALRALLRRPSWPIVGTVHSLHGPVTVRNLQMLALQRDVYPHDALMCSTHSGKAVVDKLLAAICAEFGAAADVALRPPPFKRPVIPLGIHIDEFAGEGRKAGRTRLRAGAETVVFLYFGRLSPTDKGDLTVLLQAFAQTAAAAPQARLVLAGDDTQYRLAEPLRQLAAELGCGAAVTVEANPTYARKLELFAAADVFVSPSDHLQETFGITLAEAMAAGLPVIASDWDGYRELVSHGETGFLVETCMPRFGDELDLWDIHQSPVTVLAQTTAIDGDRLAAFMTLLAGRPDLRRQFGETARAAARARFCWRHIVREYEQLWEGLVDEGRRTAWPASPHKLRWVGDYYQHVYGHYPTRFLEDTDYVSLAPALGAADAVRLCVGAPAFRPDVFEAVERAAADRDAIAVGDLIAALIAQGTSAVAARAHVGRALKLGRLRMCPRQVDVPSDRKEAQLA